MFFVLFFCLYVCFFFFCLSLFETTEFVWGLPMWTIFTMKNNISCREKMGKTDFTPTEKYSSYSTEPKFGPFIIPVWPLSTFKTLRNEEGKVVFI